MKIICDSGTATSHVHFGGRRERQLQLQLQRVEPRGDAADFTARVSAMISFDDDIIRFRYDTSTSATSRPTSFIKKRTEAGKTIYSSIQSIYPYFFGSDKGCVQYLYSKNAPHTKTEAAGTSTPCHHHSAHVHQCGGRARSSSPAADKPHGVLST